MSAETWTKDKATPKDDWTQANAILVVAEPELETRYFGPIRIEMPEWLVDAILADHAAARQVEELTRALADLLLTVEDGAPKWTEIRAARVALGLGADEALTAVNYRDILAALEPAPRIEGGAS